MLRQMVQQGKEGESLLNICLLCDTVAIQGQDTGYGRDSQAFLKPHRALSSTPEHRAAALATQERRRRWEGKEEVSRSGKVSGRGGGEEEEEGCDSD